MNLLVLLKRVPDTAARLRVSKSGAEVDLTGVEFVMNPYDEIALERALQLKESDGAKVTVLTLGKKEATKEIRTAFAMGADDGLLLIDDSSERDGASTAAAIAEAVSGMDFDLILTGWKAVDTDDGSVPHLLAALLDRPCVTLVSKLEAGDGCFTAHREVEGAVEVVEVKTPALVTAQKGLAEPRFASLKGIMKAKRKKIEERPAPAPTLKLRRVGWSEPPGRAEGRIVGEGAAAVPALIEALSNEKKLI